MASELYFSPPFAGRWWRAAPDAGQRRGLKVPTTAHANIPDVSKLTAVNFSIFPHFVIVRLIPTTRTSPNPRRGAASGAGRPHIPPKGGGE